MVFSNIAKSIGGAEIRLLALGSTKIFFLGSLGSILISVPVSRPYQAS